MTSPAMADALRQLGVEHADVIRMRVTEAMPGRPSPAELTIGQVYRVTHTITYRRGPVIFLARYLGPTVVDMGDFGLFPLIGWSFEITEHLTPHHKWFDWAGVHNLHPRNVASIEPVGAQK